MARFVVTAARRGDDGEVTEVLCARVLQLEDRVEHGKLVPSSAAEVADLIMRGDDVHMLFGAQLGPALARKVLGDGTETIQDKVQPHDGRSLKDLPTF